MNNYFDDHVIVAGGTAKENKKIKEALKKKFLNDIAKAEAEFEKKESK